MYQAYLEKIFLYTWQITYCKGISGITRKTDAIWGMIDNVTLSINTTSINTRIYTFPIDASFIITTVITANAFRTTIRWSTFKSWKTTAGRRIIFYLTLRIWTTWRRLTRIYRYWCFYFVF